MNIIYWAIFGFIAGSIANFLDSAPSKGGVLGSIVLGVAGAVVGGYLGDAIFGLGVTGFNFSSFIVAVGGSLILLMVGRLLMREDRVV